VNPSESDGQGPAHGSSSIFTGALALCALLEIAPAIAAPDEATERDHLRSQGARNWEIDLPFKKPFRLSSTIEVTVCDNAAGEVCPVESSD
jgi:hypothetical protein